LIRELAEGGVQQYTIEVALGDSRTIDVLEKRGEVSNREYGQGTATLTVKIGKRQLDQLRSLGARMKIAGEVSKPEGWAKRE